MRALSSRAAALVSVVSAIVASVSVSAHGASVSRTPLDVLDQPVTERASAPSLSHDGRILAFQSNEDGLTPDDDNGVVDVFLYDHETRELVRASGGFIEAFGAGDSLHPAISPEGRYVAFASDSNALNLPIAPDQSLDVIDNNMSRDVFVYDRATGQTVVVSVNSAGSLLDGASDHPSISKDGRYIAFQSRGSTANEPGGVWRIFVHDRNTGETSVVSVDENGRAARADSERPVISADGRYVAFESDAPLTAADRNGRRDVYRYDMRERRVELVSVSSIGAAGNAVSRGASMSASGTMIAFESGAGNLVEGDTNLVPDVFVRNMLTGATERVSVGADGAESDGSSSNPVISANGTVVAFESDAQNLTDDGPVGVGGDAGPGGGERSSVFMHAIESGRTMAIAQSLDRAAQTRDGDPALSGDGSTLVFTELPLFEPPGGLVGDIETGSMFRVGSCLTAPEFELTELTVQGDAQPIGGKGTNVPVDVRPGETLFIKLEATDLAPCDLETMRIRLLTPQGGASLPAGMTFIQDSDDCTGPGSADITTGVLATADDDSDTDLTLTLCWQPTVDDFLINGGLYQLEFLADFPGTLQPSMVVISIVVQECELEVDLFPTFIPGFTSGAVVGESQFDDDGDGNFDFLDPLSMDPSNRWDDNCPADIDTITLIPAEEATFDLRFNVFTDGPCIQNDFAECLSNSIEIFDIVFPPTAPYQQDPNNCIPGSGASSPPLPCFVTLDEVVGISLSGPSVMLPPLTYPDDFPIEKSDFTSQPGWPAGDDLVEIRITLTAAPSVEDQGNNLVSFRITDSTGHISDPQLNFFVSGCFEAPCCLIDEYEITGVDAVSRSIPTEPMMIGGEIVMCDDEAAMQPIGDGVLDVYPNQTASFVVNGRLPSDCLGAMLTIEKDESGGEPFPAGVVCVDPDGAGTEFVCFGEVGPLESDIKAQVEWTPTTADIRDEPYVLRFRVSDGSGRSSACFVRVRVCPEPVCEGEITINGETMPFVPGDSANPPTFTVTPGDVVSLLVAGRQDCGEFTGALGALDPVYRTISIQPDQATCDFFCEFGCVLDDAACPPDAPYDCAMTPTVCPGSTGFDDPLVDSDGSGGMAPFEDPFSACVSYQMCMIPEFDEQTTIDLCYQIIDASGKPVECCVRLVVCPPVTCEPSDVFIGGLAQPSFNPETDIAMLKPGELLEFKVTGGGGCEGETVQIDGVDIVCLDENGDVMAIPTCAQDDPGGVLPDDCCTLEDECAVTASVGGAPVTFPFVCDDTNMCMIDVSCAFGPDWYGLCDKILIRTTVTSDPGGEQEQTTTCSVMAEIEQCPPPTCTIMDVMVDGEVFDPATDKIIPGEQLSFTVKGAIECARPDIDLVLDCPGAPAGTVVTPGELMIGDDCVVMREWAVTWTPKVTLDTAPPYTVAFCNELVDFDCVISATTSPPLDPPIASGTGMCDLDVMVGVCPPPACLDPVVMIQAGGVGAFVEAAPDEDGCYVVQPDDVVMFEVIGVSNCPDGACNVLTILEKALPVGTMTPPLPVQGGVDQQVTSTFMWTVTDADCGIVDPTVVFNIAQLCGEASPDCGVCFKVGVCEDPPECELADFMVKRNPEMCFRKDFIEEEMPFEPLDFEQMGDDFMINVFPGDTVKLTFCGRTACACTVLTLDAAGLPAGAEISCDTNGSGTFTPCAFPFMQEPYAFPGEPGIRGLCSMVEFVVPPAGSFDIMFMVEDSDGGMAICTLMVEVADVCDDFEPNDECELPQVIDYEICGPYLSGLLEMRNTPGCRPDTALVLFDKPVQGDSRPTIVRRPDGTLVRDNNGSNAGDGKASALYDVRMGTGLTEGDAGRKWLRMGITGYPDGYTPPFNGYNQNGPHGQLGEFQVTVTFYDAAGEIISPAVIEVGSPMNPELIAVDNPFTYTNEFVSGADAFYVNLQAPRALQGGGTTVSADIEIDNTTGMDPLCNDVDFFRYTSLVPMTEYCITVIGGLDMECTPIDVQLGWFDKQCLGPIIIDCDSGPAGFPQICTQADINGEIIIGITGKGDNDFDGYLVPPDPAPRAPERCPDDPGDHGVCGCYTLCVMPVGPPHGAVADGGVSGPTIGEISRAMRFGDMNMDGRTDTADLGMLMGHFGWSVEGGAKGAGPGVDRPLSKPSVDFGSRAIGLND